MPRRKGSGVLRFISESGDDVSMRDTLWRGGEIGKLRAALSALGTEKNELLLNFGKLQIRRADLLRELCEHVENVTLARAKREGELRRELQTVERGIKAAVIAAQQRIPVIELQCREKVKELKAELKATDVRSNPEFAWQERAVQLIMLHKLLKHTESESDCIAGTHGATIDTASLFQQLYVEGYSVAERRLRALMRSCGVARQQGKRTDLPRDQRRAPSL